MNADVQKAKHFRDVRIDGWLLAVALLLTGFGLIMVLSASSIIAEQEYDGKYHFFFRQCMYAVIGGMVMAMFIMTSRKSIYALRYVGLFLVLVMLGMALWSPLGLNANGASRWLKLGPFTLQPMEFAKVALVIYLAWFFANKQEMVRTFSVGVVPPFAVTLVLCGLVLIQPDFGGAVVLAMLLFFMCLAGGTRFIYLLVSICMAGTAALLLVLNSPYRFKRLLAFLDPFKDAADSGYQLVQSLYGLGSGRIWGVGLGAGTQKLYYLPEAHNDFIMAVVGEEMGFVGVSLVFVLMGMLIWRAFSVAVRQESLQDRFTAYGMTLILALGAGLNMAVVLGTAPPKGVPMPFLSYGGSSLLTSFICVGVLLNLSRSAVTNGRRQTRIKRKAA